MGALEASATVQSYFLTGELLAGPMDLGDHAEIAGVWPPVQGNYTQSGDMVLEMAQAAGNRVHFNVDCYQPHEGSNTDKDSGFAYAPYSSFTRNF